MNIICKTPSLFELVNNSKVLGQLKYAEDNNVDDTIILNSENTFSICRNKNFQNTLHVISENIEAAIISIYNSQMIQIKLSTGKEFFISTGTGAQKRFIVRDEKSNRILVYHPINNTNTTKYAFRISYDSRPENTLLILVGAYLANYQLNGLNTIQ